MSGNAGVGAAVLLPPRIRLAGREYNSRPNVGRPPDIYFPTLNSPGTCAGSVFLDWKWLRQSNRQNFCWQRDGISFRLSGVAESQAAQRRILISLQFEINNLHFSICDIFCFSIYHLANLSHPSPLAPNPYPLFFIP